MERGDVVLAAVGYVGLYPATFVVAGLDAVRFGPAIPIPESVQVTALLVFALGYGFTFWAIRSNPFFATVVRLQEDPGHSVVSSGPYALVRHPGYAGALLAHLALPFAPGSVRALAPAAVGTILFVARTSREDRTLRDRLAGYREYQTRVRWRLLPGVRVRAPGRRLAPRGQPNRQGGLQGAHDRLLVRLSSDHRTLNEYIGGELMKLKIHFRPPSEYLAPSRFAEAGVSTAVCARVGPPDSRSTRASTVVDDTDFESAGIVRAA